MNPPRGADGYQPVANAAQPPDQPPQTHLRPGLPCRVFERRREVAAQGGPGNSTANTARQKNRVHAFLALDARWVAEQALDPGEMIRVHVLPWARFMADLAAGRLEIPGLHLGALWQLRTYARRTQDPRLLALDL